jgi:hypothetical protein
MDSAVAKLSAGQQALWFLYQLEPASAAYNVAIALRIRSAIDVPALSHAVNATVARHDALRSLFTDADGVPCRIVRGSDLVRLTVRDVGPIDDDQLRELAKQAAAQPFRLAETGPARIILLRRAQDAVLLLATHHIATDAASQALILTDLLVAYDALRRGEQPGWPPLAAGYADYVAAEGELLSSAGAADANAYWRQLCAGAGTALALPTDRPRPARRRFRGASVSFRLREDLVRRLRSGAAEIEVTPFVYLFSVFQTLLYRSSARPDFLVGCTTTTRLDRRMRDVAGYFVNTSMFRARFAPTTTFRAVTAAVADQVMAGMACRAYPFTALSPGLALSGDPAGPPLFPVLFSMVAAGRSSPVLELLAAGESRQMDLCGLRLSGFDVPQQEGQCDLVVEVVQSSTMVKVAFKYDTDLFERSGVDRLATHFVRLLDAALVNPDEQVTQLSLVDAAERAKLLAFATGSPPIKGR